MMARAVGAVGLLALCVGSARAEVDCTAAGFTDGLECSSCKMLPEFEASVLLGVSVQFNELSLLLVGQWSMCVCACVCVCVCVFGVSVAL